MSLSTPPDLSALPAPAVVEKPDAQVILSELKALLATLAPTIDLTHEDDPVVKMLELFAYRELILRERINEAARANLLAFATGSDLDQLAAFYAVERLEEEADAALRLRVQLRATGWVGNWQYYKYHALTASALVKDAAVYSPDHPNYYNMGGRVYVAVMSHELNGIPSPTLMQTVRTYLVRKDIKVLTDLLVVEAAVARPIAFSAKVYLLPDTPYAVFAGLDAKFRAAFAERQALGFDITRSWIISVLHVPGVHRIEVAYPAPAVTAIPPNEFPVIASTNFAFSGFADQEAADVAAMEDSRLRRTLYDYYLRYAVEKLRTVAQIKADLAEADAPGILQPTTRGLASYLRITNAQTPEGEWLPEDEVAFLIHERLQPMYQAGKVLTI